MGEFASAADLDKELLHVAQTTADLEGKFMSVTDVPPVSINPVSPTGVLFSVFTETLTG